MTLTCLAADAQFGDLPLLRTLYEEAFPPQERLPFDRLLTALTTTDAHLTAYYADGVFVGMTYDCGCGPFVWFFYFAVVRSWRGRGVGQQILSHLLRCCGDRRVVIDIETSDPAASNASLRRRRHAFYCRNGFRDSGVTRTFRGITYNYMVRPSASDAPDVASFTEADLEYLFARLRPHYW